MVFMAMNFFALRPVSHMVVFVVIVGDHKQAQGNTERNLSPFLYLMEVLCTPEPAYDYRQL